MIVIDSADDVGVVPAESVFGIGVGVRISEIARCDRERRGRGARS